MKISILSLGRAKKSIANNDYRYVVSILNDYFTDFVSSENHLVINFDDIELPEIIHKDIRYVGPSEESIRKIYEFTENISEDILFHCVAGKSRSTAAAIGFLIQKGYSPENALETVVKERKKSSDVIVIPNRLMISLIDDYFALNGSLVNVVTDYYETLSETIPLNLILAGRHVVDD